jgi:bifunctional non-homologous end joining protein LigD
VPTRKETAVVVDGRELKVSNLDKVLYPGDGEHPPVTKGEVIEYYLRIAPTMLPHLADRCITFIRFPNGAHEKGFFEKRCPKHRPEWVDTAIGPGDHNGAIPYCLLEEPAALVWSANLAALELHALMSKAPDIDTPTTMVFDFDPGAPATLVECCQIALLARDILDSVGLEGWAKTSGSKGMQVYVPLNSPGVTHDQTGEFALAVGQVLEKQHPKRVTTTMAKVARPGKVFVDWSQNTRHKTTVAPYSVRARARPWVSAPITWDEVTACAEGDVAAEELRWEIDEMLARVDEVGDLFAPVLDTVQHLPSAR